MYIWNIKALKKQLVERGLSQRLLFYYILIFVGLSVGLMELVAYVPNESPGLWDYVMSLLAIAIPIVGTIAAYRANGGDRGSAFAEKYFSISFVMSIRFAVYFIPLFVLTLMIQGTYAEDDAFITRWHDVVLYAAWYIVLYVFIVKHMKGVARSRKQPV